MNTTTLNLTASVDAFNVVPITTLGQAPPISSAGTFAVGGVYGNFYEIYNRVVFTQAKINATSTGSVIFELRQGHSVTGPLISSVNVNIPKPGIQDIILNLEMDPNIWGNNFTIINNENTNKVRILMRTAGIISYPLTIVDPIYGTLGSVLTANVPDRYYWFYSPKFVFTPPANTINLKPIILKGATTLNLSLTGVSEQDYRVDLLTINWGDGSPTETYKRDIFRNYRTSSIFNEVLYGKLGGSILGVYNHDYINQTSSYGTSYTLNIIIQKNNGKYINLQQPISSFWSSYYDNLTDLSILDARVLPLTGNNSFLSLESGTGSVFAVNLQ